MKKMLLISAAFLAAVSLMNVASADENNDLLLQGTTYGPADVSRARETMVQVDIEVKLTPIPESILCEGPYVLTLKYKAAPKDPELFKAAHASLADMRLVPRDENVLDALLGSDQRARLYLDKPGLVSVVLYPPPNATLGQFRLELWNRKDFQAVASFNIQICVEKK